MTDIVERLRRPDDNDPFNAGWNACLAEAADEIERMREVVKRLQAERRAWRANSSETLQHITATET